jgi:hypothetical protein
MQFSEKMDKIAPALAKAQAEMGGAVKDSENPFFKSNYADLKSVWKACKDALHNNDLSVVQSPINADGRVGVTTLLLHSSGQYVQGTFTLGVKKKDDPQADGSSITYARRYALAAFVGVCPADDDAEAASLQGRKEPISPEQVQVLKSLIKETGTDEQKMLLYAKVGSIEELPNTMFGTIKGILDQRASK